MNEAIEPNINPIPDAGVPAPKEIQTEVLPSKIDGTVKESDKPTGLDASALSDIVGKVLDEKLDKWARGQQSARDKLESRVTAEVSKQVTALKQANVVLTEDQLSNLTNVTRQQLTQAPDAGQPTAQEPQPQQTQQLSDLQLTALEIMKEVGVDLVDTDPELRNIDQTSRVKWLESIRKAAEAKKNRITQGSGTPESRLSASGGPGTPSNPIAHITDPTELLSQGLKNVK